MEGFVFLCSRDGGNRQASNDEPDDRNQLSEPLRHVAELIFFLRLCFPSVVFLQYPVHINPKVPQEHVTKNNILM